MNGIVKNLNDDTFESEVSSGVTLVDFSAEWCGPCRMMAPILEEVARDIDDKAVVAKVDVDESQKASQQFQVTSIPTVILFKDGEELERVVGVHDSEALKNMVLKAL